MQRDYWPMDREYGIEGDGIDSNGFLTINGGTIVTLANYRADGGIDADRGIALNGGTVVALGGRNDAVDATSKQTYMELTFASTKPAGTLIRIEDANGNEVMTFKAERQYQSVTFSSPELEMNKIYYVYSGGSVTGASEKDGLYAIGGVYSGGTRQQYTGNASGWGGMGGNQGGEMPNSMRPDGGTPPDGFDPSQMPQRPDGDAGQRPEGDGQNQMPEGFTPPQAGERPTSNGNMSATGESSAEFILTAQTRTFSGVSDWTEGSGKTAVTFVVNGGDGLLSVKSGETPVLQSVTVQTAAGSTVTIPGSDIQLTIADVPSENYAESCVLSDGTTAMTSILPTDDGLYQLTISVISGNEEYTGTGQWLFVIGDFPFVDIADGHRFYEAIKYVYDEGLMVGTGNNRFSADTTVSRAMAITVFGRLANAETIETSDFNDVVASSWYAPFVGWAVSNDIVVGYGDGRFGPDDAVTRQQMCIILYNYAKA